MIFFVLESHGALDFGGGVNKSAQRIAGQRMVVATGVDVIEFSGFVVASFGVRAIEEETFDFVGRVQRVAVLLVRFVSEGFQHATNIGAVGRAVFIDDLAEDQNFAGAENVGGSVVEGAPVHGQAQIAFALRGETANGGAV